MDLENAIEIGKGFKYFIDELQDVDGLDENELSPLHLAVKR